MEAQNPRAGLPLVSIIIPTFNSSKTIRRTLESVRDQTWANIEVIIVDNGSRDKTEEIASQFKGTSFYHFGPERSNQVNYGVTVSSGKYVYEIGSDFVLSPRVVEEAVVACEAGADAALIHNTSDSTVSFWAKVRKVERDSLVDDWEHVAARFMRRDVFMSIGGFDSRLYAEEDRDLHERLVSSGYRIARINAQEVHIGEPSALAEIVRKNVYYGSSIRQYVTDRGARAGLRLGPFRRAYLRHWRAILDDPEVFIGLFVYQYVRHLSALAGVFVSQPIQGTAAASSTPALAAVREQASVVIVTRNRPGDLDDCLRSLEAARDQIREVIVVDDASDEPVVAGSSTLKVRVIRNETRAFLSRSRNSGAKASNSEYVMFVDDDNVLDEGCIRELVDALRVDALAMVASPTIYYRSQPRRIWFAGGWFAPVSGIFVAMFRGGARLPSAPFPTGTFHDAFMVRRELFERVGYFDEVDFPMYLSEADLAARLRERGYKALVVPASKIWHNITPLEGTSGLLRGIHITEPTRAYFVGRNRLLYMRRHSNRLVFLLHVVIFEPVIISIHLFAMLSSQGKVRWTTLFGPYMRGVFDGLAGRIRLGKSLLRGTLEDRGT
jgi:GT2 family glycosyltransferase